jgi:hypothetical protein
VEKGDPLENLYCRHLQYLQMPPWKYGKPIHGTGGISTFRNLKRLKILALLLIVEDKEAIPQEDLQRGKALSLEKVIEELPLSLENSLMSWIILPEEEAPSTILIHGNIDEDDLKTLCYTRLIARHCNKQVTEECLKKAREDAEKAKLKTVAKIETQTSDGLN